MSCIKVSTIRNGTILTESRSLRGATVGIKRNPSIEISSNLVCVIGDLTRIQLMTNANNAVVTADQYVILTKKSEDNGNLRK